MSEARVAVVRLTAPEFEMFEELAEQRSCTLSDVIRERLGMPSEQSAAIAQARAEHRPKHLHGV